MFFLEQVNVAVNRVIVKLYFNRSVYSVFLCSDGIFFYVVLSDGGLFLAV